MKRQQIPSFSCLQKRHTFGTGTNLKAACRHMQKYSMCQRQTKPKLQWSETVHTDAYQTLCHHHNAPACSDNNGLSSAGIFHKHHAVPSQSCGTLLWRVRHLALERLTTIVPATISYTVLLCWKNRSVMKAGKKKAIEKFLFKARTVDLQRKTEKVVRLQRQRGGTKLSCVIHKTSER